jgi:hypothetical protein
MVVLPTPPLPMTMIRPCARHCQRIGQRSQAHCVVQGRRCRPCRMAQFDWLAGNQQCAQCRKSDGIKGTQRNLVLRSARRLSGISAKACAPTASMALATGVLRIARMEHAIHNQPLVVQPQLLQLIRGTGSLCDGAFVGPGHQHHVVLQGDKASSAALKRTLLHLQSRVRPQAGRALVVVGQKTAPGLGQAQQPQRVAGRSGVKNDVVVRLVLISTAVTKTRQTTQSRSCRRQTTAHARSRFLRSLASRAIWSTTRWR